MSEDECDPDAEILRIDSEVQKIDRQIGKLQAQKKELLAKKEQIKTQQINLRRSELSAVDWENEKYEWTEKVHKILRDKFKLSRFRPQQLGTINAILFGHDVLLIAPTGGGKSLCFQLPALVSNGVTIVISPLISLMEDQAWGLERLGVETRILSSTTEKSTVSEVHKTLAEKSLGCSIKLLYVTPERLAKSKMFMNALQKAYALKKLDRFAIDEVHCCSQWGHDFRPDYKFLGTLKTLFPDIPILGVTATATVKVISDVQKMLNIRQSLVFSAPFNRPNLYYHVMEKPSEKEKVCDQLAELLLNRFKDQSGIIYTFSIKDAEDITAELLKRDVKVRPYHANLDSSQRSRVHSRWLTGEIQAVVATVAFGMGIDKPNVRFVIHHTMSKSMENFYQESGRAGRDGAPAECILMYRLADVFRITTMMFSEHTGLRNAYSMVEYCIAGVSKCRRDLIATHFSEVWSESECGRMCDNCFNKDRPKPPNLNLAKDCKTLRRIIKKADSLQMNLTALKLVDAWFGKGASQLRTEAVPIYSRNVAEQIIAHLLINDYLKEEYSFTAYATHSYIKVGPAIIPESSGIPFEHARLFDLPKELPFKHKPENGLVTPKRELDPDESILLSESEDDEVIVVGTSQKRRIRSSSEGSEEEKRKKRAPKKKNGSPGSSRDFIPV